ncbi:hypothetical protein SAMN02799624_00781 [Paenibacillus sp. UNC496MF]|uniref:hypothetical protein n=1 Tax=Paenibacillus sp. UNC496MF TaxID=1502753 RepID=UPI0008E9883D|nr:hypothetical protein [Paenibacillus sp. UNC496MF]SFI39296.1 hypothetical protein SAMN02799624_00781 [Paenibacillus sp. UNC496MF]
MTRNEQPHESVRSKLFTKDGKPLRVLSTSLGLALLASVAFGAVSHAADGTTAAPEQPKLVEYSTEAVKAYFDPAVDWNLPMLGEDDEDEQDQTAVASGGGGGAGSAGASGSGHETIIINNGSHSSFGWDDLLLYHLLFNNGGSYSTSSWSRSHTTYYANTSTPYKAKSFTGDSFQNKPVVGSAVRPKTTTGSGTVTRRSSSSKPGGIGGTSSVISGSKSSSGSSSHGGSSHSSGGFGG